MYVPYVFPTAEQEAARRAIRKQGFTEMRLFKLGRKHHELGKQAQRTEPEYMKGFNFRYRGPAERDPVQTRTEDFFTQTGNQGGL